MGPDNDCPIHVGIPISILGYEIPFFIYLPYVPFGIIIGFWILFKGFKKGQNQSNFVSV